MKDSAARTLEQVEGSLRSRARRYQAERGPRRGRYPEEFKREVVALLRAGVSLSEMANRIGIPQQTIHNWQNTVCLAHSEAPRPCALRIVDSTPPTKAIESSGLESQANSRCVVRLPGGVEIVLEIGNLDARLLRSVMEVVR